METCAAGTFIDRNPAACTTAGQYQCEQCASGRYSSIEDAAQCIACPAGQISGTGASLGAAFCVACGGQHVARTDGQTECSTCVSPLAPNTDHSACAWPEALPAWLIAAFSGAGLVALAFVAACCLPRIKRRWLRSHSWGDMDRHRQMGKGKGGGDTKAPGKEGAILLADRSSSGGGGHDAAINGAFPCPTGLEADVRRYDFGAHADLLWGPATVRVLLVGPARSGKSAFVDTARAVFNRGVASTEEYSSLAGAGRRTPCAESYPLFLGHPLRIRLTDTRGWTPSTAMASDGMGGGGGSSGMGGMGGDDSFAQTTAFSPQMQGNQGFGGADFLQTTASVIPSGGNAGMGMLGTSMGAPLGHMTAPHTQQPLGNTGYDGGGGGSGGGGGITAFAAANLHRLFQVLTSDVSAF